jgi:hypothetical protein
MITDHEARRIAALWQSSGSIGKQLAAIASGAWHADDLDVIEYEDEEIIETRRDLVMSDIDRTILHDATSDHDHVELQSLLEWAEHR